MPAMCQRRTPIAPDCTCMPDACARKRISTHDRRVYICLRGAVGVAAQWHTSLYGDTSAMRRKPTPQRAQPHRAPRRPRPAHEHTRTYPAAPRLKPHNCDLTTGADTRTCHHAMHAGRPADSCASEENEGNMAHMDAREGPKGQGPGPTPVLMRTTQRHTTQEWSEENRAKRGNAEDS